MIITPSEHHFMWCEFVIIIKDFPLLAFNNKKKLVMILLSNSKI